MLSRSHDTVKKSGMTNVEIVEGQPASTNLSPECCDGIFIRNVYHHFADPSAMNASLWRSLKAGGRLAVIDFRPVGTEAASPAGRDGGDQHGVLPETVSRELVEAGFTLISSEDRPDRWFIVVVEKTLRCFVCFRLDEEQHLSSGSDGLRHELPNSPAKRRFGLRGTGRPLPV